MARCSRTSRTCRTGRTRGTTDHPTSADIKTIGGRQTCRCEVSRPSRWSGLIGSKRAVTTAVRRDQQLPCLSCRRRDKRLSPRQQPGIRSVIARLSGRFAREKRREHTQVCDRSGERCKARGSKRERSVNKKNGAFARARTVDPVIKSHLLYRLSYERTYRLSTLLNILLFSKNAS